jgi:hypothetical protein
MNRGLRADAKRLFGTLLQAPYTVTPANYNFSSSAIPRTCPAGVTNVQSGTSVGACTNILPGWAFIVNASASAQLTSVYVRAPEMDIAVCLRACQRALSCAPR